jgi:hypothetical protein
VRAAEDAGSGRLVIALKHRERHSPDHGEAGEQAILLGHGDSAQRAGSCGGTRRGRRRRRLGALTRRPRLRRPSRPADPRGRPVAGAAGGGEVPRKKQGRRLAGRHAASDARNATLGRAGAGQLHHAAPPCRQRHCRRTADGERPRNAFCVPRGPSRLADTRRDHFHAAATRLIDRQQHHQPAAQFAYRSGGDVASKMRRQLRRRGYYGDVSALCHLPACADGPAAVLAGACKRCARCCRGFC